MLQRSYAWLAAQASGSTWHLGNLAGEERVLRLRVAGAGEVAASTRQHHAVLAHHVMFWHQHPLIKAALLLDQRPGVRHGLACDWPQTFAPFRNGDGGATPEGRSHIAKT